jgi:hypothetical protein
MGTGVISETVSRSGSERIEEEGLEALVCGKATQVGTFRGFVCGSTSFALYLDGPQTGPIHLAVNVDSEFIAVLPPVAEKLTAPLTFSEPSASI